LVLWPGYVPSQQEAAPRKHDALADKMLSTLGYPFGGHDEKPAAKKAGA